jgi:hypothetical protein
MQKLSYFQCKRSTAVDAKNLPISCAIGMPLVNASKFYRIYGYSTVSYYW